jgi:hypothetical protein
MNGFERILHLGWRLGLGHLKKMMGSIPLDLAIVYIHRRAAARIAIVSHYLIQKGQLVSGFAVKSLSWGYRCLILHNL